MVVLGHSPGRCQQLPAPCLVDAVTEQSDSEGLWEVLCLRMGHSSFAPGPPKRNSGRGGGSSSSSCGSCQPCLCQVPIPTSPLVPRDEGDRQDLCLCLAEVHKGLPGLGTWQRKPWDDGGSCVGLSLQAGVTPKMQPRKSLRSFPRTHPKS